MTRPTILGEPEFLALVQSVPQDERPGLLKEMVGKILEGEVEIVSLQSDPLELSVFFSNLLHSLDAVLGYELIALAEAAAKLVFADGTVRADDKFLANLLDAAGILLVGRPSLGTVLRSAADLVEATTTKPQVQLAAARLLYDQDALGDSPDPWISLVVRNVAGETTLAVTGLSALMHRWPSQSLDFLLSTGSESRDLDPSVQKALANLIALSTDEILEGVSYEQFLRTYREHAAQLPSAIRQAIEFAASDRGWTLPDDAGTMSKGALVPIVSQQPTLPVQIAEKPTTRSDAIQVGEARALRCRFPMAGGVTPVYPLIQLQTLFYMRAASADDFGKAELEGFEELSFVRYAVEREIAERSATAEETGYVELLNAVYNYPAVHSAATQAVKMLLKLGFGNHILLLGASEYHQDRLLMHIVAAALRRAGLMGATVANRAWEDPSLWLASHGQEAHVIMAAEVVAEPQPDGVFEFKGFRVFIRVDAVRDQLANGRRTETEEVKSLVEAANEGADIREVIDLSARARLALQLGDLDAKGSAFEALRASIARIAGVRDFRSENPVDVSNDEAFERFITGKAAIYCGGAINSLLIETWWMSSQPGNFIEILNHAEIAKGFQVKEVGRSEREPFVENSLRFGLKGPKTAVEEAKTALTKLFRAVGRGLQRWSEEVMRHPEQLNGSTKSCEAARAILRPPHASRSGKYAFATRLSDPARLIKESDRFYSENEGRTR